MKASSFLLSAALFTGLATTGIAGPGIQYWTSPSLATPDKQVEAQKTETPNPIACPTCKVTAIEEFQSINPNGRPPHRWVQVGTKHDCALCDGAITVANGKTTNTMGRHCKINAEATNYCCAPAPKTPTLKS